MRILHTERWKCHFEINTFKFFTADYLAAHPVYAIGSNWAYFWELLYETVRYFWNMYLSKYLWKKKDFLKKLVFRPLKKS